jgi:type I restriction enzyme S subunit
MFVADNANAYKVYEQKNAIKKDCNLGSYFIDQQKFNELKGFEVYPNDIIVSCAGTIGETYVLPENIRAGIINQALMIIRLYSQELQEFYLLYFDFILKNQATNESKGTAIKNIPPFDVLKSFMIPIPPIAEQQRILVAVSNWMKAVSMIESDVDDINSLIINAKSKILDLAISGMIVPQIPSDEPAIDALRRINPSFQPCDNPQYEQLPSGWCECHLSNLCAFLSRGKSPKYSDVPNMYPVYAQKCNLKEGGISLVQARFLDPSTLSKWPDVYKLKNDDILINSTGTGTVGRTRLFNDTVLGEYPFVVPDSHVSVVRCFGEISSRFLYYYLTSSKIQQYFEENLAGSTNQKELYIGVIGATSILVPPIAEQQRIVDKVNELFTILDSIQNSLDAN